MEKIKTMIDYKAKVLEVYPDAYCEYFGLNKEWEVWGSKGMLPIGSGDTEPLAWENAWDKMARCDYCGGVTLGNNNEIILSESPNNHLLCQENANRKRTVTEESEPKLYTRKQIEELRDALEVSAELVYYVGGQTTSRYISLICVQSAFNKLLEKA